MGFVLHFVNTGCHVDFFLCVEPSFKTPGINPSSSRCRRVLLKCYLNKFARILLSVFASVSVVSLFDFGARVILA